MKLNKAPWLTHTSQEIFEYDIIINRKGRKGTVKRTPEAIVDTLGEWCVEYDKCEYTSLYDEIFYNESVVER